MTGRRTVRRVAFAGVALLVAAGGVTLAEATGAGAKTKRQTLHANADAHGALRFTVKRLRAHPGRVTIIMRNPSTSGIEHAIAIEGRHVDKDGRTVAPGHTSRVTVTLRKGTYTFYCPVPGHEAAGMKGKLVVR